jgi:hypothetical protein
MASTYTPSLVELADWLAKRRQRIREQVTVRERSRAAGKLTEVQVDHRLPCDLDAHAGWHISTRSAATFLPRDHFSSEVRAKVKTAAESRGRALVCHNLSVQEVDAVMSYHLDKNSRMPVFITVLGLRCDARTNPALPLRTIAAALVLKHHLHAIAETAGRGGYVYIELAPHIKADVAHELGFQAAPRIRGVRPGDRLLRQPAPHLPAGHSR